MKFVFTGPESSGKSTLSNWLAQTKGWPLVPELAREYLTDLDRPYLSSDILHLSDLQIQKEGKIEEGHAVLDTDMLTLFIWMAEVFPNKNGEILRERFLHQDERHYFLCRPDIPWEPDPLRENPNDRDRLFDLYLELLTYHHKTFTIVEGEHQKRKLIIENAISDYI